ncbi:peroxisome membrane protein [Pilobolus umbonatus]|nr:peroxisome membrane protein [Pilobolus umbonatus]
MILFSSLLKYTNKGDKGYTKAYSTYINTIEDIVRALTILLPGRFEDSDICLQGVLTLLNLLSLYHTKHLIQRSFQSIPVDSDNKLESFNESLKELFDKSKWLSFASSSLSVLSYSEVIIEMILNRQSSKRNKWLSIMGIEGAKALLRFILFFFGNRRMILHPTHFIRNVDPVSLDLVKDEKLELVSFDPRTGTALSMNEGAAKDYHDNSTITSQLGELLWIIRPFIYVLLTVIHQYKYETPMDISRKDDEEDEIIEKEEENRWKPWMISLCIDLISRSLRSMQPMSNLEKDESRRRDYLLLYYLLKGPIYLRFTRKYIQKFCDTNQHRPVISIIAAAINDYLPFWEDSYFYTAGS